MKIALVTDAWMPQVNGVVTTLVELVRELRKVLGDGVGGRTSIASMTGFRPLHRNCNRSG